VKPGDVVVRVDPRYFRPAEVETLLGDPSKAAADLGWVPQIGVSELVTEMAHADLAEASRLAFLKKHGYDVPPQAAN
jgi:GDPmannose 4,6-dehydratase